MASCTVVVFKIHGNRIFVHTRATISPKGEFPRSTYSHKSIKLLKFFGKTGK